jgi:Retinal pigment epithelial membrane protein
VANPASKGQEDGWLLTFVYDSLAGTTSLCILSAQRVSHGPICTIRFGHHLPYGLHNTWTPQYCGPAAYTRAPWADIQVGASRRRCTQAPVALFLPTKEGGACAAVDIRRRTIRLGPFALEPV